MTGPRRKIRRVLTLGGEAAEADPILEEAFFHSDDYSAIEAKTDHRRFIVGRTGAGKSAAFAELENANPDHVIRISPENLSLPYITNLQAIRYLDSLEINLDTFWNTLWRHVLIVEILKHRYKVTSPSAKANVLQALKAKLQLDKTKMAALAYLDEVEGKFWCETDERVRDITDKLTQKLEFDVGLSAGSRYLGVSAGSNEGSAYEVETRMEQIDRFQRVVNENQLARLNKMIEVLDDQILSSVHDYRYVIIDDLDRDWVDERIANDLVRCLFSTVYGFQHVKNLKILVALRTNIFQELDFGRRGKGQEEKLRALVLDMKWNKPALEQLLNERVRVVTKGTGDPVDNFTSILPGANNTMGRPLDYILDRTLLRPRDAISFANECLAVGAGKSKLAWSDIKTAEFGYSSKRLLALRDEWSPTYPGIDRVFEVFRKSPSRMTKSDFSNRIDEAMLLPSDTSFDGVRWVSDLSAVMLASGPTASWFAMYGPFLSFLYRIGLVGVSTGASAAPVFFSENATYTDRESSMERAEYFYVHRTYQSGLDVELSGRR